MKSLLFALALLPLAASAGLIHQWTFNDGTADDSIGSADGVLIGGASISSGQLVLDGVNDYMRTSSINSSITTKTLMAWITLPNLTQGAGSALTLQDPTGVDVFDAIVYAEAVSNQWMNGSDYFNRTQTFPSTDNGGALETAVNQQVHIAITYASDNSIKIYRNGVLYASPGLKGTLQTYDAGSANVLIGVRHADLLNTTGSASGIDAYLAASIDEARIYDTALTPTEIANVVAAIPEPSTFVFGFSAMAILLLVVRRRNG